MRTQLLFVNYHLNYFEALRRMEYWTEQARIGCSNERENALNCIGLLRRALVKYADCLYMEGE